MILGAGLGMTDPCCQSGLIEIVKEIFTLMGGGEGMEVGFSLHLPHQLFVMAGHPVSETGAGHQVEVKIISVSIWTRDEMIEVMLEEVHFSHSM